MILLQREILTVISEWADSHDKPISLKELADLKGDINPRTVRASAETLCRKGYLRKSCAIGPTAYILIRKL
jgi:DNA-binding IclR family transcriptional regulator